MPGPSVRDGLIRSTDFVIPKKGKLLVGMFSMSHFMEMFLPELLAKKFGMKFLKESR